VWATGQLRQGRAYPEIETTLQIDPDARETFRRTLRYWKGSAEAHAAYNETHIAEAPACAKRWTEHVTVEGDHLILADPHAPFHDAAWMNRCMDLAQRWGVHKVGIAGDLFEQSAFSHFGRQIGVEWRDEKAAAMQMVRTLLTRFEGVTICQGNHEARVLRRLAYVMDGSDWDEMLYGEFTHDSKLNATPFHWFEIVSGGEHFRVTHPKNASITPGAVAAKIAAKHNISVIASHGHINGVRRDTSDRLWCIDVGMCAELERLAYVTMEDNTRPRMQQGAVLIKDGVPVLVEPGNVALYERMMA